MLWTGLAVGWAIGAVSFLGFHVPALWPALVLVAGMTLMARWA